MTSYTKRAIYIACCVSIAVLVIGLWSNIQYTNAEQKDQEQNNGDTHIRDSLILSIANRLDSILMCEMTLDSIMSARNAKEDSSIVLLNKIIKNQKRELRKK